MPTIAFWCDDELEAVVDKFQEENDYDSRSAAARAAIRAGVFRTSNEIEQLAGEGGSCN